MPAVVSLRDIAIRAGVSSMTVSRALRKDPRVLPETKKRILKVAKELGYRPDPNLQQMMGYMRKSRLGRRNETIAFVWPDVDAATSGRLPQLQRMVRGARARAEEFGFGLDEFWLEGTGLTTERLCSILRARGIQCVVLAPLLRHAHRKLRLEWNRYSIVAIGLGLWQPQLHRVHFDHYGSMLTILRHAASRAARIALVVDKVISERMHHAWTAAFLTNHPLGPAEALRLLRVAENPTPDEVVDFLNQSRADILIGGMDRHEWWLDNLKLPKQIRYVTVNFSRQHPEIAGIDQRDDLLGSYAVDMAVAQYHRREYGIPKHPKVMLSPGDWVESRDGPSRGRASIAAEIR